MFTAMFIFGAFINAQTPEKAKIVFSHKVGDNSDNMEIFVMDTDGNNIQQLTDNQVFDDRAAWSPTGKKIAFQSKRDGTDGIYVMDADGKNVQRLTNDAKGAYCPIWSPDGKKIAFLSEPQWIFDILVMDADGKNLVNLTNSNEWEWITQQCWFDPAFSAVSSAGKFITKWAWIKQGR